MTIYSTILKILRKNASSLIIGLVITIGVSFLMSGDLNRQLNEVSLARVAILGPQKSEAAKDFTSFMKDQQELVTLADTSEKGLDDALYFGKVDYILWLPADFEEQLVSGNALELAVQTRPGTYNKALVDTSVDQFINTYQDLRQADPTVRTYQGTALMKILETKGTVHHDAGYTNKLKRETTTTFYNILAYGMFMVIFNGYGAINLVFNRKEIQQRNQLAPISSRSLSRKISISALSYSLAILAIFLSYILIFSKSDFDQSTVLLLLNTLAFFFTIICFSVLVTSLVKDPEAFSGISNVYILGSSFIGGVFIGNGLLPDFVNKIAAFTPTYWFTQNNGLIGETMHYDAAFYRTLGLNSGILILFGAVFLLVHYLLNSDNQFVSRLRFGS